MKTVADNVEPDRREYLAAERTLLAYIRTGVAMMGIGFVVARFSLMLRMLPTSTTPAVHHEPSAYSLWLGTALVLAGTAVMLFSALQYILQIRLFNRSRRVSIPASWLAIGLAFAAGISGLMMAIYLVTSTRLPN